MKYIALLLLIGWSVFMMITMPNLKPSDNLFLWLLGAFTIMYSTANIIIEVLEFGRLKRN